MKKKEKRGSSTNLIIILLIVVIAVVLFFIVRGIVKENKELAGVNPDLEIMEVKKINDSAVSVKVIQNNQEKEFDGIILIAYDKYDLKISERSLPISELEGAGFEVEMNLENVDNSEKIILSTVSISKSGKERIKDVQDEYIFSEEFGKVTVSECVIYSQCDDNIKCTTDSCSDGFCIHTKITSCINSDGCCPTGCTSSRDNDCKSSGGGGGSGGGSGGGTTTTCTDTCSSLNYNCGVHTVCGTSVNCGSCSSGYSCQVNGSCIKDLCIPNCAGKNCGSDGCSGSCGTCSTGFSCQLNGTCIKDVIVTCNGVNCKVGEYCSNGACLVTVPGHTYFVATNGNDNNPGTYSQPFYSWQKGVQVALPGDIIYIRGGIWQPTSHILLGTHETGTLGMLIDPMASDLGVSGTAEAPIRYYNYPNEMPILDGSLLGPNYENWYDGISIGNAQYIYLKGLTIRNIHQNPPNFTKEKPYSEVYGVGCDYCANMRYENIIVHDVDGRGFQYWGGAWTESDGPGALFDSDNTSWINCDAYNLYDRYAMQPGNGADGWKVGGQYGNHFYWEGCRAFNYSDDGFDPSGQEYRTFKNCWAMSTDKYKGLSQDWAIEGNGFKMTGVYPDYVPNYVLGKENFVRMENCITAYCVGAGFYNNILVNYDDQWPNNGIFYNNLAYRNYIGFQDAGGGFGGTRSSIYKNNIAYGATSVQDEMNPLYEVAIYLPSIYNESNNTWRATMELNGWPGWEYNPAVTINDNDFVSVDVSQLMAPRKVDGSLPDITFGHLKVSSDLIDKGAIIPRYHCATAGTHPGENCREWYGAAPDIGAFESNY